MNKAFICSKSKCKHKILPSSIKYPQAGGTKAQRQRPQSWPEITSEWTDDRWMGEDGVINWQCWNEECYNWVPSTEMCREPFVSRVWICARLFCLTVFRNRLRRLENEKSSCYDENFIIDGMVPESQSKQPTLIDN